MILAERLRKVPGVIRSELCGSLRRRRETVKDIDILVSADDPSRSWTLRRSPEVHAGRRPRPDQVERRRPRCAVGGHREVMLNADLRVVPTTQFPFALHYFTGSKEHNIRLRQRAIDRGLTLNEYGLAGGPKKSVPCRTEADIYKALDLAYIPPELREDTGEIEAAEDGRAAHADRSRATSAASSTTTRPTATAPRRSRRWRWPRKELGFEYFGVGDHSQSLTIANGLSPRAVQKQQAEIDALNDKLKGIRIIKGTECDILEDGSLDYHDELLQGVRLRGRQRPHALQHARGGDDGAGLQGAGAPRGDDARPRHRPAAASPRGLQDRPGRGAASRGRSTGR